MCGPFVIHQSLEILAHHCYWFGSIYSYVVHRAKLNTPTVSVDVVNNRALYSRDSRCHWIFNVFRRLMKK